MVVMKWITMTNGCYEMDNNDKWLLYDNHMVVITMQQM